MRYWILTSGEWLASDRQSVLGTYSIDKNGDTTLTDYGIYTVSGGELEFDSTIKAATD